jgi:hypothetical protein
VSDLRALLHQLADAVADRLEQNDGPRYYDQDTSPLPKQTHCRLVRQGTLPGFKRAGRVLVERAAMHRYIEQARVEPVLRVAPASAPPPAPTIDPIEAALLRRGFREAV